MHTPIGAEVQLEYLRLLHSMTTTNTHPSKSLLTVTRLIFEVALLWAIGLYEMALFSLYLGFLIAHGICESDSIHGMLATVQKQAKEIAVQSECCV